MSDCCSNPVYVQVPGPAGAAGAGGAPGSDGDDGLNAFAFTTANFAMPAVGGSVSVLVTENRWAFIGQIVQVEAGGGFEVTALPAGSTTAVTLENLGWAINVAPAAVVASGSKVSPSGPEGPAGAAGGAPDGASFITRVAEAGLSAESALGPLATGYVKSTTVTGVVSTVAAVPIAEINSGAALATTVLAPDGATGVVAVQVNDARVGYGKTAMGANDVNWALDRVFTKTLPAGPGTTTITFSNLVLGKAVTVILAQDGASARSVDWTHVTMWSGGAEIEMSATLGCKAVYSFIYDGTDVIGTVVNDCF